MAMMLLLALSVLQALTGVETCKNAVTLDRNVVVYLHAPIQCIMFQGLVCHQMLITMLLLVLSVLQALAGVETCKNAATLDQNVAMYLHAQGLFQGLVGHQMLTTMLLLVSSVLQALAGVETCKNAVTLDQNVAMYLHAQGLFQGLVGHQMLILRKHMILLLMPT